MFQKLPLEYIGVFSPKHEQFLVKHILRLLKEGRSVTRLAVQTIAYRLAEELKLNHKFNKSTKTASLEWLNAFLQKFKQIQLPLDQNSILRVVYPPLFFDFKKTEALIEAGKEKTFHLLSEIYKKYDLLDKPEHIYIFTETVCYLSETNDQEDNEESLTIVACYSAAGKYLAPVIVLKGVRLRREYFDSLPKNADIYLNNQSGSVNRQVFYEILKEHFIPKKPKGKCVLFFQGQSSYLDSDETLKLAEENDIIIMNFHAVTMQFFKVLKNQIEKERLDIMEKNDNLFTKLQACSIIGKLWPKAVFNHHAAKEFNDCGLYPIKKINLPDECYELLDSSRKMLDSDTEHITVEVASGDLEAVYQINNKEAGNYDYNAANQLINDIKKETLSESESDKGIQNKDEIIQFHDGLLDFEEEKPYTDEEYAAAMINKVKRDKNTQTAIVLKSLKGKCKSVQNDLNSITQAYKKCFVANCPNTSRSDIKKVFVKVQLNDASYKKWVEKFGQENIQSPYVFCENHFDLQEQTTNWADNNTSNSKENDTLKATAVPIYSNCNNDELLTSIVTTKIGPVQYIRPKLIYDVERSLDDTIKSEVYEHNDKTYRDSHIQCSIKQNLENVGTQINVSNPSMKLFYCSIPHCPSTNADVPQKLFFSSPDNEQMKMRWAKALGVDVNDWMMSHTPSVHCCEDHFNELDKVDDWERYKSEGCKVSVSLDKKKRKATADASREKKQKLS